MRSRSHAGRDADTEMPSLPRCSGSFRLGGRRSTGCGSSYRQSADSCRLVRLDGAQTHAAVDREVAVVAVDEPQVAMHPRCDLGFENMAEATIDPVDQALSPGCDRHEAAFVSCSELHLMTTDPGACCRMAGGDRDTAGNVAPARRGLRSPVQCVSVVP